MTSWIYLFLLAMLVCLLASKRIMIFLLPSIVIVQQICSSTLKLHVGQRRHAGTKARGFIDSNVMVAFFREDIANSPELVVPVVG